MEGEVFRVEVGQTQKYGLNQIFNLSLNINRIILYRVELKLNIFVHCQTELTNLIVKQVLI